MAGPSTPLTQSSRSNQTPSDTDLQATELEKSQADAARYKRLYEQTLHTKRKGTRKRVRSSSDEEEDECEEEANTESNQVLGRNLMKYVSLWSDIKTIVQEADVEVAITDGILDKHPADDAETEEAADEIRRSHQRSHASMQELVELNLIPNFCKTIDRSSPRQLTDIYGQLSVGARSARGNDILRLSQVVADWVNETFNTNINRKSREGRGIKNDVTGRLLCPIEHDWDDQEVRDNLRDHEDSESDFTSSFFIRLLYPNFKGNSEKPTENFLRNMMIVKTYKFIFTSPSSADDVDVSSENNRPTNERTSKRAKTSRKAVAAHAGVKKVTGRSVAYATTLLAFCLSDAALWTESHAGLNFRQLYETIVDYFDSSDKSPARKREVAALLNWWNKQVFPHGPAGKSTSLARAKAMEALGI